MKLVALVVLAACSHGDPAPRPSEPLPYAPMHGFMLTATDLITSVADDWGSTHVILRRWRRDGHGLGWRDHPSEWDGVIGSAGLGWGDGLHGIGAPEGRDGPVKREGDNRSPAGAFRITQFFGYEPEAPFKHYLQLTDHTECVDDPKSTAYNTIVEHTGSADWRSSEHMRRTDDLYSLGAVVNHNAQRTPGHGSCIFLHVWSRPVSPTVGCTAMAKENLAALAGLGDDVVFVQLTRAEYSALQDQWGLPPQ